MVLKAIEAGGILLYAIILVYACITVIDTLFTIAIPWILLIVIIAFLMADFFSGLVHWCFDTYGSPDTRLIGPMVIAPFREHHVLPGKICEHGFLETNGNSFILCGIGLACFGYLESLFKTDFFTLVFFWAALTSMFSAMINQVHSWSHAKHVHVLIALLQRMRIILHPDHHAGHHRPPHKVSYCILNGHCNYILDRVNFWRRFESFLGLLGIDRAEPDQPVDS